MPKPTFDIIGYRARLGLTQPELAAMLHIHGPRHVAAWEAHQRSNGRKEYGPVAIAIAHMELIERLWRLYHRLESGAAKRAIGLLLHDRLCAEGPKRKTS